MARWISSRGPALVFVLGLSWLDVQPASATPTPRPGWPKTTRAERVDGLFFPAQGVALFDVDPMRSGVEVIAPSGADLHVFGADGTRLNGWPQRLDGIAQKPPAIGDVDGDGAPEILQVAYSPHFEQPSRVYAIRASGELVRGWPVSFSSRVTDSVTLVDLDDDPGFEIIIQAGNWPPRGQITVVRGDGTPLLGWPVALDANPVGSAAAGDIDGNGRMEIAHLAGSTLWVRTASGTLFRGISRRTDPGRVFDGSVVLAEIDPSRAGLEIVAADVTTQAGPSTARLVVFDATGALLAGFPLTLSDEAAGLTALSVADLDGDGRMEIVAPVLGVGVVIVRLWPTLRVETISYVNIGAAVAAIDVDGDGALELVTDGRAPDTEPGVVHAFRADGSEAADFPLRMSGTTTGKSAAFSDLDGDGSLDLAIPASDGTTDPPTVWFHAWNLPESRARRFDWPMIAFDVRRTGCTPNCTTTTSEARDGGVDAGTIDAATQSDAGTAVDVGPSSPQRASCGCGSTDARPRNVIWAAVFVGLTLFVRRVRD